MGGDLPEQHLLPWLSGVERGEALPSGADLPQPPPPPAEEVQSTPAPAPARRKTVIKGILVLSHSQKQRAVGHPLSHPSPLEANEFPWRPPAGACLGVGEGIYVSYLGVGGPDTCAWCACVCVPRCAPVWGFLCVSGSLLVWPWISPRSSGCICLDTYIFGCVPPCVRVSVHMSPRVGSSAQQSSPW